MANQFLGRADTAVKLQTARTISLTGNVTGSIAFDGSANVAIATKLAQNITLGIGDGGSILQNGSTYWQRMLITDNSSTGDAVFNFQQSTNAGSAWINLLQINDDGNIIANKFTGALSGNATTATSASKWTTARTITLSGNASGAVSLDGSANVTLSVTNSYAANSGYAENLNSPDNRNVNTPPSGYSKQFKAEFKGASVVNSPYGSQDYVGLLTFAPYSDASGGNKYQIAFNSDKGTTPYLSIRTANGGASSWPGYYYLPTMNTANGYWGFNFPSANSYLRTPPNGLLPNSSNSSSGISTVGTSGWPFASMYAKTFVGNLNGNATTATTATNATNATNATYTSMVNGIYTGNGGQQPPSYIPKGKIRFNMMNGLTGVGGWPSGGYCDCMLMDTYTGNDVPYSTGIGILRNANPRAWIFSGGQGSSTWSKMGEIITSLNIASQSVSYATSSNNSNQLGGVAAANYINTSDTLILRGTV
jgi:hypothetical protein